MEPWKKYLIYGSIVVGGGLLFILVETIRAKNTGFETKTLWDWLELLIIPFVLAIGAFYLNRSERNNERQIATDRQQEAALQSYLDRMSDLLLNDKLRTTKKREVRDIARTRTLTALRGLDGKRKGIVVLFLYEAGLIVEKLVVDLARADLTGAYLMCADLEHAYLSGSNLSRADLFYANMSKADLTNADMRKTHLAWTNLQEANMAGACLAEAALNGANLRKADLGEADLTESIVFEKQLATVKSLQGTTMRDGTKHG